MFAPNRTPILDFHSDWFSLFVHTLSIRFSSKSSHPFLAVEMLVTHSLFYLLELLYQLIWEVGVGWWVQPQAGRLRNSYSSYPTNMFMLVMFYEMNKTPQFVGCLWLISRVLKELFWRYCPVFQLLSGRGFVDFLLLSCWRSQLTSIVFLPTNYVLIHYTVFNLW